MRTIATFVLAFALTGCAIQQAPVRPSEPAPPRTYHEVIDISGRLAVRYQQQGEQSLNGSFTWRQRADVTQVNLLSPFGQILARITIRPGEATFQRAGQPIQSAPDVDQLTLNALGWPLPVSGLRAWLQGFVTTSSASAVTANPEGETALTSADGWRIIYDGWTLEPATANLRPRRIDLTRQTREAGEVQIRIVIDGWQLPTAGASL